MDHQQDAERLKRELERSEKKYRDLFEFAPVGYLTVGGDGLLSEANQALSELMGRPVEALIGVSVESLVTGDCRSALREHLAVVGGGEKAVADLELETAERGPTPVRFHSAAVVDEDHPATEIRTAVWDLAETRHLQSCLSESETRFKMVMDDFPGMVVIYDSHRRFEFINRYGRQVFGLRESDVLGQRDEDLQPPEIVAQYLPALEAALESGRIQETEVRVQIAQRPRLFAVTYVPWSDHNGAVAQVLSTAHDVTDLLEQSEAADRNQRHLQALGDMIPDPIILLDIDLCCRYVNPAFERLTGLKLADLRDQCLPDYLSESDRGFFQVDRMERVAATGQPDTWDLVYPSDEGARYFSIRAVPEFGPDDVLIGALCLARDMTREWEIWRVLQESEAKYRGIVEVATEGIWMVDENFRTAFVNRQMAEMLGRTVEEMIGTNPLDYTDMDSGRRWVDRREGRGEVYEFGLRHRSGRRVWGLVSAGPMHDDQGRFKGSLAMITDITARKEAEQELAHYRERLEELVEERTRELARAKEDVEREMAERQKAEIELRTLHYQLIEEFEERKALSRKLIDTLEADRMALANHLHDQIGQLLIACRVDLERALESASAESKTTNLLVDARRKIDRIMSETKNVYRTLYPASLERLGLVAALKGLFQETRNKTGLNIHFFHEPIAGELSAEYRLALFRIVQEALANVIKYASAGDVHVNLTGEGGVVYLSIEDDGQGFDPKELKWRERDEKLMGLRILKERVYQLGGRFDIDARPGHGVLLTVELPLSVTETKGVDDE